MLVNPASSAIRAASLATRMAVKAGSIGGQFGQVREERSHEMRRGSPIGLA